MKGRKRIFHVSYILFFLLIFSASFLWYQLDACASDKSGVIIVPEMFEENTANDYSTEGYGWRFDKNSKTLYLNNFCLGYSVSSGIECKENITINVTGDCVFIGSIYCKSLHITGTGSLTFQSDSDLKGFENSISLQSPGIYEVKPENTMITDIPLTFDHFKMFVYSLTGKKDKNIAVKSSRIDCRKMENCSIHMSGFRPSLCGEIINSDISANCADVNDTEPTSHDLISDVKNIINSNINLICGPYDGIYNPGNIKESSIKINSQGKKINNKMFWGTGIESYNTPNNSTAYWQNSTFNVTANGPSILMWSEPYTVTNCKFNINSIGNPGNYIGAICGDSSTIKFNNCNINVKAIGDAMSMYQTKLYCNNSKISLNSKKTYGISLAAAANKSCNTTINGGYIKATGYKKGLYYDQKNGNVSVKKGYLELNGKKSAVNNYKHLPSGKKYIMKAGSSKKKAKKVTRINNKYKYIYIKKK